MRVFVSSTVYDLLDVRAAIADLLRSLNIQPVMSDDKLSDFELKHDANSIETCLVNVASSDEAVVVLDKRYGPSLKKAGFDDVSATHLEYRHALKNKIPIHFYVRDRLVGDHATWGRNGHDSTIKYPWVQETANCRLFSFLDERCKLDKKNSSSNWYTPFSDSVDLIRSLRRHFERRVTPDIVADAINMNRFPFFDVVLDATFENIGFKPVLKLSSTITNAGGATAFDFRLWWDGNDAVIDEKEDETSKVHIMVPGVQAKMQNILFVGRGHYALCQYLNLEYRSQIGVMVKERYQVSGSITAGMISSSIRLLQRTFHRAERVQIEMAD